MNAEGIRNTSAIRNNEDTNVANGVSNEANEGSEEELVVITEESDHDPNGGLAESSSSTRRSLNVSFQESALTCVCNRGNPAFAYGRTERCSFCGNYVDAKTPQSGETSDRVSDEESATSSANNLHLTLVRGIQSVPQTHETSHEVQAASTTNSTNIDTRAGDPVIQSGNVPVEGFSDSSVPLPCPPQQFKLFVLREDHPSLNEMTFSVYCMEQSKQGNVGSIVQQLQRNRDTSFQAVSCGEENSSQREHKHFHSLNIENDLQIRFELPREGNFRLRLEQEISQVPLARIMSLSQNRIPSSIARVHVEPLGEPGELYEEHLRMTLKYGTTSQRMLIPIWFARPSESR